MPVYARASCCHPDCKYSSIGPNFACTRCGDYLCALHRFGTFHSCANLVWEASSDHEAISDETYMCYELAPTVRLLDRINREAIASDLERLRPGATYKLDLPLSQQWRDADDEAYNLVGGYNQHFPLEWNDGARWLLRVRLPDYLSPPLRHRYEPTLVEITTMNYLADAGLAVPRAWARVVPKEENPASNFDIDYMFVERLEGTAADLDDMEAREGATEAYIVAYAAFHDRLSKLTFPSIGCLHPVELNGPPSNVNVGPLVGVPFFNSGETPYYPGPFSSISERYLAQIDLVLDRIRDPKGGMYPTDPVSAYLVYREIRTLLVNDRRFNEGAAQFYLKHADMRASQIIVDEGQQINGVVDWEWAYTTTKTEAFASPIDMYTTAAYMDGDNRLQPLEEQLIAQYDRIGRDDLADCVRNGRVFHRLRDLYAFDLGNNTFDVRAARGVLGKLNGLRDAFLGRDAGPVAGSVEQWLDWAAERYAADAGYQEVKKRWEEEGSKIFEPLRDAARKVVEEKLARQAAKDAEEDKNIGAGGEVTASGGIGRDGTGDALDAEGQAVPPGTDGAARDDRHLVSGLNARKLVDGSSGCTAGGEEDVADPGVEETTGRVVEMKLL